MSYSGDLLLFKNWYLDSFQIPLIYYGIWIAMSFNQATSVLCEQSSQRAGSQLNPARATLMVQGRPQDFFRGADFFPSGVHIDLWT